MSEQLLQSSILFVFIWLVIGGLGVPVPEDVAVISTGVLIERGLVNPVVGFAVLFAGVLGGDAGLFFLARRLGPRAYENRLIKRALPPERRAKIEAAYQKHGGRLVFFARHVAGLRGAVFAMAGIHRMDPRRFLLWDALAACISIPFAVALGYFGSMHVARIRADEAKVEHYILLIAAFALLGYVAWRNVHKFRAPSPQ